MAFELEYYNSEGHWRLYSDGELNTEQKHTVNLYKDGGSAILETSGRSCMTYVGNRIYLSVFFSHPAQMVQQQYSNGSWITTRGFNCTLNVNDLYRETANIYSRDGVYVDFTFGNVSQYSIVSPSTLRVFSTLAEYDEFLKGEDVSYNWQSVPSISGKNGILQLSTIQSVYLNDGEPVNDALESYIDFIDDSKVAVLVEQEIDDLTKVTVKYVVPAGTYEYIKLVYKTGSVPTSVTDGTAVDILQAAKKVILSGIADGNTYFFKIFTDITESEPYEFTTVRPAGDNFFTIDFSSDGRDTMRYNASKTIHVQADSMYSMRDIDYYAAQGALADPVSPSNPTYTISNGEITTANNSQYLCWAYDVTANQRIIPANCTLWFEFDAYFLNSEGYLDWRMYNNQAVEVIYWCWDTKYAFSANQWYNCKLEATIVNGIIPYVKYYVDNNMVEQSTENDHMLCIDEDNPVPLYFITFQTTKPTKLKNMKIYWE